MRPILFGAICLALSLPANAQVLDRRNAEIYVLELDGEAVTLGDFSESECEALLQSLLPRVSAARKIECVLYKVERETS